MKTTYSLFGWGAFILLLLVGACSPPISAPPGGEQTPQEQQTAAVVPISTTAVEAARQELAQQLGVPVEQLEVFSVEPSQFPDSCLGLPQEDEMCAEVIVSGYQGVILGEGVQYEFRVSEDGSIRRFLPGAALSAQQLLAAQLGKAVEAIRIVRTERVDWPDACLGIETPGLMCAQVITPGFRVLLEADGKRYEFHTDLSGSDVRLALRADVRGGNVLLKWQAEEGGVCQSILLYEEAISTGQCDMPLSTVPLLGRERTQDVQRFVETYAPFEAQTPAGSLTFYGRGGVTATLTEQRMLAEWARQLWTEYDPQAKVASTVVIAFHREGGLAGICEDVLIYRSGIAEISACRPAHQLGVQKLTLNAAQMQEVYEWADTYLPFESSEGEANTADAMTTRLVFNGRGQQNADELARQSIQEFALEIADQAHQIQDPQTMQAAKQALSAYFEALMKADYPTVINRYGGSYEKLIGMNPDVASDDLLALWTRACQQNGFVCNLTVKNWVHTAQLSDDEFRFTVELQNPDGTLFIWGPCCGAEVEDLPPMTQFDFIVKRVGDKFVVQTLPIYVP